MATTNPMSQIDQLVADLTSAVSNYKAQAASHPSDKDFQHRRPVAAAAEKIVAATRMSEEGWTDYSAKMGEIAVIRLFMDWKVFEHIPLPGQGSITYKELATKVDAEESLVIRLASVLISTNILVASLDGLSISHSHLSTIYVHSNPTGLGFRMIFDEGLVPFVHFAQYFKRYGRKEPRMAVHCPHTFGWGKPEMNNWDLLGKDPERFQLVNKSMSMMEQLMPVLGMYDFSWLGEQKGERTQIVDVGGGKGHVLKKLMTEIPGIKPERCVLQDRDVVLDVTTQEELGGIKAMAHDFFTEQPVKDAHIYYVRRIMHDWSDENCAKILQHLTDAMAADSRVLICEQIQRSPPTQLNTLTDLMMMCIGGKERNEEGFRDLALMAGLRVVAFHKHPTSEMAIIECEKVF